MTREEERFKKKNENELKKYRRILEKIIVSKNKVDKKLAIYESTLNN